MNNEAVLQTLAALVRPRLGPDNPLGDALFATVAEEKPNTALHTYAVLQTSKSGAQELVPGNYTYRIPCRLFAVFFPPEDADYTPENIEDWMQELGLALVAACAVLLETPGGYENFYPLDATVTGPIHWAPAATGGYEGTVDFTLVVQF